MGHGLLACQPAFSDKVHYFVIGFDCNTFFFHFVTELSIVLFCQVMLSVTPCVVVDPFPLRPP